MKQVRVAEMGSESISAVLTFQLHFDASLPGPIHVILCYCYPFIDLCGY